MTRTTNFSTSSCSSMQPSRPSKRSDEIQRLSSPTAEGVMGGVNGSNPSLSSVEDIANQASVPLWSDSLQSLLEQPPSSLPQYLVAGGLAFTAILGVWSWFGTVEEVSIAQGQLAPQGEVFKVQPAISGEVVQIAVQEGDYVRVGQTMAQLDQRLINNEIERLTHSLDASQQKLLQTQGLIRQTQLGLNILKAMSTADIAAHRSSIAQEQATISTGDRMLTHLQVDRQAQLDRMERLLVLVERGAFAKDQLFEVEQALRDRDRSITEAQGLTEQSQSTIARLEAELAQTQAMAQKQELDAIKQFQQLEIEATQLEATIQENQALLERSQTELTQTALIAPVDGIVSALEVANTGVVMQPGQTFAEIAPSTAPLVLSALLPNAKAGLVETGMPVNIKLDAFPYQDYGMITGSVLSISPDAKPHETLGAVYRLEISLDATEVNHEGTTVPLRAGQTATAEVIVRRRRIISLVLEPIRKLQKGNLSI